MDNLKIKAQELIDFIYESPTSYHAVESLKKRLEEADYKELNPSQEWNIEKGGKYYTVSGQSALIAFRAGTGSLKEDGFRIIGAHTDSPCFKIKPVNQIIAEKTYVKLNTEVYGGPILSSWFDRPLALAGKVVLKNGNIFKPEERIININRPLMVIPNLAIHFNREVNDGYKINPQVDTLPLLALIENQLEEKNYLLELLSKELGKSEEDIIDFELFLYEYEKGKIIGLNEEFMSSPRLDDLWMVHAGLKGLLASSENKATQVLVCIDHEEIGSQTAQGADSMFVLNILKRINIALSGSEEDFYRALTHSLALSSDLAHGVHPNYLDKHDPTNRPVLGKGPVLKYSAKQKYITTAYSASVFAQCCEKAGVPLQKYANRSDVLGGSTIAKFIAANLCIDVVDIGTPIFGMHSVRELGAIKDNDYVERVFTEFYSA
jgi:aspartyl aminopeptidase